MQKVFRGKKILITSGPVWVPIDRVRIITTIFGGALGAVMAGNAQKMGANVLLLMGPGRAKLEEGRNLKVIKFKYFGELFGLMKREISSKKYDIVIHSAAVPDYMPEKIYDGKIKSGKKDLTIKLKPTVKIVDYIKKWDPSVFLVKFKLEVKKSEQELISIAQKSMARSKANMIVANDLKNMKDSHRALIIDKGGVIGCAGKKDVAQKLFLKISKSL